MSHRSPASVLLALLLLFSTTTAGRAAQDTELVPAGIINDVLGQRPLRFVPQDEAAVRGYAELIRTQFFRDAPLCTDRELRDEDLRGHAVIIYGTVEGHRWLRSMADRLPFRYGRGTVTIEGREFRGDHLRVVAAIRNPADPTRGMLLYTAARAADLPRINEVFHGPTEWLVADGAKTLATGSFSAGPLSPEQLQADLDQLIEKIETVHPATVEALPPAVEAAIARAEQAMDEPMSRARWWRFVQEILIGLEDAHSSFALPPTTRAIDLPLVWLEEGPVVREDRGELRRGDRLRRLGEQDVDSLLSTLEAVIPAETPAWVRHRAPALLQDRALLDRLGIAPGDGPVELRLERGGEPREVALPVVDPSDLSVAERPPWLRWKLDAVHGRAIFTLDQCRYDDFYRSELRRFFQEVQNAGVARIVVDVRANSGGNSRVVDEFLRYLAIDEYASFTGAVRTSEDSNLQRGQRDDLGYREYGPTRKANAPAEDIEPYAGELELWIGPGTFSSGNWFAAIVQDNALGRLVGEPTGNAPSSYGDILQFSLPESRLSYTLSYKRWIRPDAARDPASCLQPDVEVVRTAEDVAEGRDALVEWLDGEDG